MTANTTDLAAALNECMPLRSERYGELHRAEDYGTHVTLFRVGDSGCYEANEERVIGILWAECARRGWNVELHPTPSLVSIIAHETFFDSHGTDALAFARAFAAAKRAEGGGA